MLINRVRFVTFFGIIIILSLGSSVLADELTPAKEADIKKLMELTGAINIGFQLGKMMSQQINQQIRSLRPDIPTHALDIVDEEIFNLAKKSMAEEGGLIDILITIYSKYYTHQEIKGLTEFYQTDLGKKTIRIMPNLMSESMIAGQQWAQRLAPALTEIVQRRLKEEGIELPAK